MGDKVKIPRKAVSDGTDIAEPTRDLLYGVQLLGLRDKDRDKDGKGFDSAFTGPPQSVALIEAGATAAAKWWSAGASAAILATWGTVAKWFTNEREPIQVAVIAGACVVSAALVIAIGYLLASDVRGRAQAAVATIEARSAITRAMLDAAARLHAAAPDRHTAPAADGRSQFIALPTPRDVENHNRHSGADAERWQAIAISQDEGDRFRYVVVKGPDIERWPGEDIEFV